MKLNRVLGIFVLTGILTIASVAAQAQTRVMVRFGSPAAGIAVNYAQQAPGAGYTWVSGYYSGVQWIPGQWVYRVDSRYQRNNYYGNRDNGYYNSNRRDNGNGYYGNNYGRFQNDQHYGNNNRYRQNNGNDRNNGWHGRNNQHDNRGGRH